jgi:hypoxanthine-guanine phosphoribosyltransferase/GNAT superfamily N-acetyltransferase
MNTIFLSEQEVAAYIRDLLKRLTSLGEKMPKLWCPIGPSGFSLAQAAMRENQELAASIEHMFITYDRAGGKIAFPGETDPSKVVKGKQVLLVDGSVHSGDTLAKVWRSVEELGASEVCSYSLVVRASSSFIPNYFGLLVGDHDRALFLRPMFPNNRLQLFGCVRKLITNDQTRPMIASGATFIDKFSWSDLMYETKVDSHRRTYVYEQNGEIKGFISFKLTTGGSVLVDTIGVDKRFHGKDIGGCLMRWAETCARHADCLEMRLWSVEDSVEFYKNQGYKFFGDKMTLDGTPFHLMGKKVLYNLNDEES